MYDTQKQCFRYYTITSEYTIFAQHMAAKKYENVEIYFVIKRNTKKKIFCIYSET